jgi:predicted alpha/beta hydrolase family esterase
VLDRSIPGTTWIAVAHSFGCLALARHLDRHLLDRGQQQNGRIKAVLMVAPADPVKFDLAHRLPQSGLGIPATVIGSEDDPWMPLNRAREWADRWGARFTNLGKAGHINVESGFGPWPLARYKVDELIRDQQRQRRIDIARPRELNYAV